MRRRFTCHAENPTNPSAASRNVPGSGTTFSVKLPETALPVSWISIVSVPANRGGVGATPVGFAPLVRDQGNSKLDTGDVGRAVTRGVLLAYDTQKRLQ